MKTYDFYIFATQDLAVDAKKALTDALLAFHDDDQYLALPSIVLDEDTSRLIETIASTSVKSLPNLTTSFSYWDVTLLTQTAAATWTQLFDAAKSRYEHATDDIIIGDEEDDEVISKQHLMTQIVRGQQFATLLASGQYAIWSLGQS